MKMYLIPITSEKKIHLFFEERILGFILIRKTPIKQQTSIKYVYVLNILTEIKLSPAMYKFENFCKKAIVIHYSNFFLTPFAKPGFQFPHSFSSVTNRKIEQTLKRFQLHILT